MNGRHSWYVYTVRGSDGGSVVEEDWGHPPRPLEICFMGVVVLVPVSSFFFCCCCFSFTKSLMEIVVYGPSVNSEST